MGHVVTRPFRIRRGRLLKNQASSTLCMVYRLPQVLDVGLYCLTSYTIPIIIAIELKYCFIALLLFSLVCSESSFISNQPKQRQDKLHVQLTIQLELQYNVALYREATPFWLLFASQQLNSCLCKFFTTVNTSCCMDRSQFFIEASAFPHPPKHFLHPVQYNDYEVHTHVMSIIRPHQSFWYFKKKCTMNHMCQHSLQE